MAQAKHLLLFFVVLQMWACHPERRPPPTEGASAQQTTAADPAPSTPQDNGATATAPNPLTLRLTNAGPGPRYVDLTANVETLTCQAQRGGRWEPCHLFAPFCTEPCLASGEPQSCPQCARPRPVIRRIDAGAHYDIAWPGTLFDMDESSCCHRQRTASPGRYGLGVCAHPSIQCGEAGCPDPEDDGVFVDNVMGEGERECLEVDLELPRQEQVVLFTFGGGATNESSDLERGSNSQ